MVAYRCGKMTSQKGQEEAQLLDLVDVRAIARSGRAREIRLVSALSLADVARAVGTSAPTIYRWENGHRRPCGEQALRYGALLDALARKLGDQ